HGNRFRSCLAKARRTNSVARDFAVSIGITPDPSLGSPPSARNAKSGNDICDAVTLTDRPPTRCVQHSEAYSSGIGSPRHHNWVFSVFTCHRAQSNALSYSRNGTRG